MQPWYIPQKISHKKYQFDERVNLGDYDLSSAHERSMLPFDEKDKLLEELVASQPLASSFGVWNNFMLDIWC